MKSILYILLCGFATHCALAGINEWTYVGLAPEDITSIAVHPTNPDIIYASALDVFWDDTREGGLFKTTNRGLTWDTLGFRHMNVMDVCVSASTPEVVWIAALVDGAWRSTDAGFSWEMRSNGMYLSEFQATGVRSIAICPTDPLRLIAASGGLDGWGEGYFTEDSGENWTDIYTDTEIAFHAEYDPNIPALAWIGGFSENIFRSLDSGRTFVQTVPNGSWGAVIDMRISSARPGALWYITAPRITVTIDTAESWQEIPPPSPSLDSLTRGICPIGVGDTIAATVIYSTYISFNSGDSWQPLGSSNDNTLSHALWCVPNDSIELWTAWYNHGLWALTYVDSGTVYSPRYPVSTSEVTTLKVYPNPAIENLWVSIPAGSGSIVLYDLLGRTVGSLVVSGRGPAEILFPLPPSLSCGRYFVQFRAKDQNRSITSAPVTLTIVR